MRLDKYHYHEALDRCDSVANILEYVLLQHPVIKKHKDFKKKAEAAQHILYDLYQDIGAIDADNLDNKKKKAKNLKQ